MMMMIFLIDQMMKQIVASPIERKLDCNVYVLVSKFVFKWCIKKFSFLCHKNKDTVAADLLVNMYRYIAYKSLSDFDQNKISCT